MTLVPDQSLFKPAVPVYNIYQIINNTILKAKYYIQIAKAYICIYYYCSASQGLSQDWQLLLSYQLRLFRMLLQ